MGRHPKSPCPMTFSGPRVLKCKRSEACPWWIPNADESGGDCAIVWGALALSIIANEGLRVHMGVARPKAAKRKRGDRAQPDV